MSNNKSQQIIYENFLVTIACVAAALNANAEEDFKPQAGDLSTEVNISLFNGGNDVRLEGLQLRYFFTDKIAARLGINYNGTSKNESKENIVAGTANPTKLMQSTSDFGIMLGAEYHFAGWKRLDTYAGIAVGMNFQGGNEKFEKKNNSGVLQNGSYELNGINHDGDVLSKTQFAVGLFTGFDFYIYKGLYTGAEMGLYYNNISNGSWKSRNYDGNNWHELSSSENKTTTTNTYFAFRANPTLKLGWKF